MKNFDESEWARTRSLLREHLTAPKLPHPDFVNHQVLAEIARSRKPPRPAMFPLRWLAWLGATFIFCAGILTVVFLPREGGRSDSDFISQVVSARTEMPQLSVSEFRVPDERGVVIWIEGADYIPADSSVR